MLKNAKRTFSRLQYTPWHLLFSAVASLTLSIAQRRMRLCYKDRDGDWVNQEGRIRTYSPSYSGRSLSFIERDAADRWNYQSPLTHGEIVIDIGAGGGEEMPWLASQVGTEGRVVAIEANPAAYRCLLKTISSNELSNVTPVHVAVTDRHGDLFIEDDVHHHLSNRISNENNGTLVPCSTVDTIVRELALEKVDLIKMNIEGAECLALAGATNTIRRCGRWVISCHDFIADKPGNEHAATHERVISTLVSAGFSVLPPRQDRRAWIPFYVYASR